MNLSALPHALRGPAARLGSALYLALAINLVQGVLLMRLLEPSDYGRWLELFLVFSYGQHFHLGLQNSVLRQLPLLRGRDEPSRARELAGSAHGGLALLSGMWLLAGGAVAVVVYPSMPGLALVVVAITALEAWTQLAIAEMKTAERFGLVGLLAIGRSVVNLVLLVLVWWLGLEGAYLRWGLLLVALTLVAWVSNPVRVRWRWNRDDLRFMLSDGGPILLVGVLFSFQVSMDKTLIKAFLDEHAMGRYGAAAILMTMMMVIPSSVGQTAYPRMLQAFGRGVAPSEIWSGVRRQVAWVLLASAVVAALGGWLMPWALEWVLPKYLPGVRAAQWLLPGTVFLSASVPVSYFLQTIRRQRLHAVVSAVGVGLQIALGSSVLARGGDIEGLAAATSAALLLYFLLLAAVAARASRRPV